jgi:hypothetical protein
MQKFLCSPIQDLENIEENVLIAGMSMEYRGYFDEGADYFKELIEGLPKTLDFYDMNYIVVGHTTVDMIAMIKNNKVIAIDVPLGDNEISGQALLIENDELYVLNYDATKEKLK